VDGVKFRGQVTPGDRLIIVAYMAEIRGKRRNIADTQGFVNGQMVYEGRITGMVI
jgi:3-hydroxyacyl-[acyl-carrier-protein] dehydratase